MLSAQPDLDGSRPISRSKMLIAKWFRSDTALAYLLILPAAAFYAVFQLVPMVVAFGLSFFDWNGLSLSQATFVGLDNYRELMTDPQFRGAIEHNIVVMIAVVIFQCGGSFLLAVLIQAGVKGGRFLKIVFFAPVVMSSVALGMLSIFIFSPGQGLLNTFLRELGLERFTQPWLGSPTWALPAVTVTAIVAQFGLSVLLFSSALASVDNEMLEAAEVDGASQAVIIWRIVLPNVSNAASVVLLLGITSAFRLFDFVFIMTSGGPFHSSDTIVTYLYSVAFQGNRVGYGNAVGVVLFVILLVISIIQLRLTRRGNEV